ncbi:hypothetical protein K470DRAFT_263796 [Piedraia hortae CBS 480.64]|uniref:Uncharacterized protein n=1 Tax=Piedraia hortae CBS 480.64 TaxID=1314780 RepID=A0A6A7C2Z8_9PEZI|nr:hypothetical protein K470DRAFT_263796 [Piedraia hortae CBS 480.64]
MWHGDKSRMERQILRPVDCLRLREGHQDVWIGDVLELCTGEHAMFYGCEIHTTREQSALIVRAIKLARARPTAPSSKKARLLLPIKEGALDLSEETVLLDERDIVKAQKATKFEFAAQNGGHINADFEQMLRTPHPARWCELDVVQCNFCFWTDGTSAVRSSRWNPIQALSMTLAGRPRKENFHPSAHIFITAGEDIKGHHMIGAMIPEISRLQRGILAFNPASRSRRVLVGGPVMVQADNAEVSELSSHKISSNLNCRDLPYDNLHCVLLGYVQMLWAETVKDRRVKPDLEDLDLRTAAPSRDGGIQSMLLYATNLTDVDAWSEKVQQTYEEMICDWADMWGLDCIRSKVKLHLLCHVVMWVRRFGPNIGAQCETHECTNKHLRGNVEHTNRQAYSLDVAGRYSVFSGALHLAAGGWWRINQTHMTYPGRSLVALFSSSLVQEFWGLPTVQGPGSCRLWRERNVSDDTIDSALHTRLHDQYLVPWEHGQYQWYHRMSGLHPCRIGSFVQWTNQGLALFRVRFFLRETLRGGGIVLLAAFQEANPQSEAEEFSVAEGHKLIAPAEWNLTSSLHDIMAVLNVQHLCDNGCRRTWVPSTYRVERRHVKGDIWKHDEPRHDGWFINAHMIKTDV